MFTWGSFRFFLDRRQTSDFRCDFATGADQIQDQPLIDVERALVLGPVPQVVALGQDAPNLWSQTERIRQHLEDDVALRRPESVVPQRRQTERMSRAVREVEPALERVPLVLCVFQPSQTGV